MSKRAPTHAVQMKTVILFDKRRVSHETLEAIAEARDGAIIPVERDEFNGIQMLHLFLPDLATLVEEVTAPKPPRETHGLEPNVEVDPVQAPTPEPATGPTAPNLEVAQPADHEDLAALSGSDENPLSRALSEQPAG